MGTEKIKVTLYIIAFYLIITAVAWVFVYFTHFGSYMIESGLGDEYSVFTLPITKDWEIFQIIFSGTLIWAFIIGVIITALILAGMVLYAWFSE